MSPKRMPSVFRKSTKEVRAYTSIPNFPPHMLFLSSLAMVPVTLLRRRLKIKAQPPLKSSEILENRLGISVNNDAAEMLNVCRSRKGFH